MNLIIEAPLCEPPSSPTLFRDVTLYAKTFIVEDVLLSCRSGTRTLYWKWLKAHGAHDFISYLIKDHENEGGFKIGVSRSNLNISSINYNNVSFVLSCLSNLKR